MVLALDKPRAIVSWALKLCVDVILNTNTIFSSLGEQIKMDNSDERLQMCQYIQILISFYCSYIYCSALLGLSYY